MLHIKPPAQYQFTPRLARENNARDIYIVVMALPATIIVEAREKLSVTGGLLWQCAPRTATIITAVTIFLPFTYFNLPPPIVNTSNGVITAYRHLRAVIPIPLPHPHQQPPAIKSKRRLEESDDGGGRHQKYHR